MTRSAQFDAWTAGDAYEAYMGRWSRPVAAAFLDWLDPGAGLDWLDIGCGTGALTATILERRDPRSLAAVDPSEGFVAYAADRIRDRRLTVQTGDGAALPFDRGRFDVAVSGLVLNFIPDRAAALAEFARVLKPGGLLGVYVWDYPGGGMGMIDAFWEAAQALDPAAAELNESRRFPDCTADGLAGLCAAAGLDGAEIAAIDRPSVFADFDDFWTPFTLGAGPAPGYCMSLDEDRRAALRAALAQRLGDGTIRLPARAWAVRARMPG